MAVRGLNKLIYLKHFKCSWHILSTKLSYYDMVVWRLQFAVKFQQEWAGWLNDQFSKTKASLLH